MMYLLHSNIKDHNLFDLLKLNFYLIFNFMLQCFLSNFMDLDIIFTF